MSENLKYINDLLDCIPSMRNEEITKVCFENALERYSQELKELLSQNDILNDYTIIHHTETYQSRNTWGEDSFLGDKPLPKKMFHWNQYKQIASAHVGVSRGYNFVETAIYDITRRYGAQNAIEFMFRAWNSKMIILDDQVWFPVWMLIRSVAFKIDYEKSKQEYFDASERIDKKESESFNGLSLITQELAKSNKKENYNVETLSRIYWDIRDKYEKILDLIKDVNSYSDFINGIRNVLPIYIVLERIAEECLYSIDPTGKNSDFVSMCRFVDERKADIRTSIRLPFFTPAFFEIVRNDDVKSMKRKLKFYYKARVIIPRFVYNSFYSMIETNDIKLELLEDNIYETIRPGHKFYLELCEDRHLKKKE